MGIFFIFYSRTLVEFDDFYLDARNLKYKPITFASFCTQCMGILMVWSRITFDPYLLDTIKSDLGLK